MILSRDPEQISAEELRKVGITLRKDLSGFGFHLLICHVCGDEWIPHRPGTVFGYERIVKLGPKFSRRYWVCLNGCNASTASFDDYKRRRNPKKSASARTFTTQLKKEI